jgi:hypothetical protein
MLYLSIKIHQIQAVETRDTFIIYQQSNVSKNKDLLNRVDKLNAL